MRSTPSGSHADGRRAAGRGLALLLVLALGFAAAAPAAPASQQTNDEKRSMILAYDSLEAILRDLANYRFDRGVGAPLALRAYVLARKDNPATRQECEEKLLAFLKTGPAPGGTMAACRSLSLIGGPASVPLLAEMILKPETTDPARYALERIPGAEADNALLAALGKAQGDVRRGIISTLGDRPVAAAVPALDKIAGGGDPGAASDAVKALGRIGTAEAGRALVSRLDRAKGNAKGETASALLYCAGTWRRAGKTNEAAAVYDKLLAAGLPDVDRQAAFRSKLSLAGADGRPIILKTLAGKDAALYQPAIAMIHMAFDGSNIGEAMPLMAKLPEDAQVQFVAVLAGYPADAVLPAVLKAADSPYLTVRTEALRTVGRIGKPSAVPMLADRAAGTAGDEQALAREILIRLKGTDVETAILDRLRASGDEKVKAALIEAAGERRIADAKPLFMDIVRTGSAQLRLKAIGALKSVSTPADLRDLLALLFTIDDETGREAMQDTAASVALTIARPLARGDAAENMLAAAREPRQRADLLRVLGKIGDDTSLPLFRRALADPDKDVADAAVRGLADWPSVSAKDDVFAVASSAAGLTHKVLALRAYVRMLGLEPYRRPDAAVADIEKALALAPRPEEKRLVLGLLPRFPCASGLRVAESLQGDAAVAAEAKAAADRIRKSLSK